MGTTSDGEQHSQEKGSGALITPDRWVACVGIMVFFSAIALELQFPLISPESVSLGLASGVGVFLWGIYPSAGAASGSYGWIRLVGPAAIAVFLYTSVADGLRMTPQRSLRTLFSSNATIPGSPYFLELDIGSGNTLRVFDIESLDDKAIVGDVAELRSILENLRLLRVPQIEVDKTARDFISATLQRVGIIGEYHDEAMNLVAEVLKGRPDNGAPGCDANDEGEPANESGDWAKCLDSEWKKLIEQARDNLNDCMLAKRLDRFPFVIATIASADSQKVKILFGGDNAVAGQNLRVLVVANPHRKSVRGLMEAIVVEVSRHNGPLETVTELETAQNIKK